ncbi:hypothetical protein GBAR_LOCUS21178, partial [Geodia barretti]
YRSVVDGDAAASPVLLTVADKVKAAPAAGLPSLTVGEPTTKSGEVCGVWSSVALPVYSPPALPPENLTQQVAPPVED